MNDKTAVVIFQDKSRLWLNSEDHQKLVRTMVTDSDAENVLLGNKLYRLSNIVKILFREDFYREYPKEAEPLPTSYPQLPEGPVTPIDSKRAARGILRGLATFAEERKWNIKPETRELIRYWKVKAGIV